MGRIVQPHPTGQNGESSYAYLGLSVLGLSNSSKSLSHVEWHHSQDTRLAGRYCFQNPRVFALAFFLIVSFYLAPFLIDTKPVNLVQSGVFNCERHAFKSLLYETSDGVRTEESTHLQGLNSIGLFAEVKLSFLRGFCLPDLLRLS